MMIRPPKMLGVITSFVALNTTPKRSCGVNGRPVACCSKARRRMQFSTMMTAPSTMMPKSSAPRLMRFALTLLVTMPVMVKSIDSGMIAAAISAARKFPSKAKRTTITSTAPSRRLLLHGRDRRVYEVGAVVNGVRDHAFWQSAADFLHPFMRRDARPCGCFHP